MYLPTRLPEVETETREQSPFTLDALIAWLRTKNPEETYCYSLSGHCLLAQYLRAQRIEFSRVDHTFWADQYSCHHDLPPNFDLIARTEPRTFGAALSRATAIRGV